LLDFSLRPIGAAFFGGERSARCEVPRAPRLPVRGFPPRSPALALSRSPPANMANAWLRMKHENYDELRRILDIVGQTVKVHAR